MARDENMKRKNKIKKEENGKAERTKDIKKGKK
jgi:hypothetical protein